MPAVELLPAQRPIKQVAGRRGLRTEEFYPAFRDGQSPAEFRGR